MPTKTAQTLETSRKRTSNTTEQDNASSSCTPAKRLRPNTTQEPVTKYAYVVIRSETGPLVTNTWTVKGVYESIKDSNNKVIELWELFKEYDIFDRVGPISAMKGTLADRTLW